MKIALTGAGGYLGSRLLKRFTDAGHTVLALGRRRAPGITVCDFTNAEYTRRVIGAFAPDIVVHSAGVVPKTSDAFSDEDAQYQNIVMLENILSAHGGRTVFCSSMAVYHSGLAMPVTEDSAEDKHISVYGHYKLVAERLLAERLGDNALSVRIPGLFDASLGRGLVYNVMRHVTCGTPLTLPDTPMIWAAVHVDDAVDAVVYLSLYPQASGVYQMAYDEIYAIDILAEKAAAIAGVTLHCEKIHPRFRMSLSRLHAAGYRNRHSLETRLREIGDAMHRNTD